MSVTKVYGQEHLIQTLDIAFKAFKLSDGELKPHFILTGPSGNGKTAVVNYFCEKYKLNFLEINGAGLTKEGMSGNSVSKALSTMSTSQHQPTVVFVDEWDKMYITSDGTADAIHEATRGVQNEFLKILEGGRAQVFSDYGKYANVDMSKVLFIFAGAFNNETNINLNRLSELGVKREFLGRVPHIYEIKKLSLLNLLKIAEEHPLLKQWLNFAVDPEVDDLETIKHKCLAEIKAYISKNYEDNVIGARWVSSLITKYFLNGLKLPLEDTAGTMPNKPFQKISLYQSDEVEQEETPQEEVNTVVDDEDF